MKRLSTLLSALLALLVLAACGSPTATAPDAYADEVQPLPFALRSLVNPALPEWAGGYRVDVYGVGMGSTYEGDGTGTLAIPDPDTVDHVVAVVVLKSGTLKYQDHYSDPDEVVVTAGGAIKTLTDGDLERFVPLDGNDVELDAGSFFHATFQGPVSEVRAEVTDPAGQSRMSPRGLFALVFRADPNVASYGTTPHHYLFGGHHDKSFGGVTVDTLSHTETVSVPGVGAEDTLAIDVVVGDLEFDERVVVLDVTIGGVPVGSYTASGLVVPDGGSYGPELLVVHQTFSVAGLGLPTGDVEVQVTARSPKGGPKGDSIYLNAVNVSLVTTPPPPGGTEGCTPGYWRQSQHYDSWRVYEPGDDFEATFGLPAGSVTIRTGGQSTATSPTLGQAVRAVGGDVNALARHAVASLLNSTNPGVDFPYTEAEVIAMVQAALGGGDVEGTKDLFANANELGCPLN